jgi:hypothetical protein
MERISIELLSLAMMNNVLFLLLKFENALFLQQIKYELIINQDKLSNPFAFIRWLKFNSVWTLIALL